MAPALRVWRRNAGQFFFSFVTVGLVTVCAQDFFARAAPAEKERWLAATLLLGTLAAFAGVRFGQRLRIDRRRRLGLCAVIAGLGALLGGIAAPIVYVIVHVVARWLINLGVQAFDAGAAALADAGARRLNDHASTSLRFVGMLAGPITFGAAAAAWELGAAVVLAGGLVGAWAALGLGEVVTGERAGASASERPPSSTAVSTDAATSTAVSTDAVTSTAASTDAATSTAVSTDEAPTGAGHRAASLARLRLLVGAALACYAGNYLLATSVVYLAADAYRIAEPAAHAGRLMTVVYASTVAVSLTIAGRGLRVGPAWIGAGALCLLLTGLGLARAAAGLWAVQVVFGALLGGTFALVLLAVREAVSRAALAGHPGALALFNNLGNTSALVAFGLMVGLVELGRALTIPFVEVIAGGLVGLSLVALVALALALRRGRAGVDAV
ncbi:MAG: hypothetical protein R3B09_11580 [Nannocystaceae bacterium]